MKRYQIGARKRELIPKSCRFLSFSRRLDLHYNRARLDCRSPLRNHAFDPA
jgi:hypothetical protein